MLIDTNAIFSMTQANQNFSSVAKAVEKLGEAYVFKNNKPKFIITDIDNSDYILDLTEDERIEIIAKRVLKKYLGAFKELAK